MLDIKLIRENVEEVINRLNTRGGDYSYLRDVKEMDEQKRIKLSEVETLKSERNQKSKLIGEYKRNKQDATPILNEVANIGDKIAVLDKEVLELDEKIKYYMLRTPNLVSLTTKVGKDETENREIRKFKEPTKFDFEPKDHVQIAETLDILDFDRATKVSGPKFYYLKNEAVFLEQALIMYALNALRKHGFEMFITPDVAKEEVLKGIGFNPRGNESNVYTIEEEGTCLVATAEITLGGYHSDEILDKAKLPLLYGGLSHCFRREAGAAGQFSKGLYRVHQFDKVEMFAYATPEQSDEIHEKLRQIEEEIFEGLGLPFHVVDTCTGDLGAPAYRKWDLEAWMPGRNGGEYGEVTSTSNCTDYQARRLNIKYKDDDGKNKYVHTLNGTAIAVGRAMLAILENYQNADGSVTIPEVLVPYCGFDKILPKK
jgi:seryl-tRNA synthetase